MGLAEWKVVRCGSVVAREGVADADQVARAGEARGMGEPVRFDLSTPLRIILARRQPSPPCVSR